MPSQIMNRWTAGVVLFVAAGLLLASCAKKESATDDSGSQEQTMKAAGEGLMPIPLVLPKPMFVGTPVDIKGISHLQKPLGKPRPDFLAPAGVTNVALNKPVSSSVEEPIIGELPWLTDGDKAATDGSEIELDPFTQHMTIDLEANHEIFAIVIWHYHRQARVYFDVIVQMADDAGFTTNVKTLFNNDIDNSSGMGVGEDMHYVETNEGKLIDAKGTLGRYVRFYSRGNNANDQNHYIEVEVYGRPAP